MKYLRSLIVILSCLAVSHQASAKVYKWTDKDGQVHYSEHPSATQSNEVIKPKTGHSDPVNYPAPSSAPAAESTEITATPPPKPPKSPEACNVARKNQEILKTSVRVQVADDKGQLRYLLPEELKEKMTETNQIIEENCN